MEKQRAIQCIQFMIAEKHSEIQKFLRKRAVTDSTKREFERMSREDIEALELAINSLS